MNALNDLWEGTTKIVNSLPGLGSVFPPRETAERVVIKEVDMYRGSRGGGLLLRIAGLSGATAVMMAAYGAHVFKDKQVPESQTLAFANGNKMHLIHSVALLGVPLTRRPILVGTLLSFGILLFSGSCYCHALTGNTKVRMITPYGGMALILGWLAMLL